MENMERLSPLLNGMENLRFDKEGFRNYHVLEIIKRNEYI